MIEITPHLGIGDLIIIKMIALKYNLVFSKININRQLIETYSSDHKSKQVFIEKFLHLLFPTIPSQVNNSPLDFVAFCRKYPLQYAYLYDTIQPTILPSINNEYSNAIVFHTKMRHDGLMGRVMRDFLPELQVFFKQFRTSRTIIIVGERNIGKNIETITHSTQSLYTSMSALKENNTVIDLTQDVLTDGIEFDLFLNDLELMNKCACNVTFGIGGPFVLTAAFSKRRIAVIPYLSSSPHMHNSVCVHDTICQRMSELEKQLTSL
jgi:hypothetical protein